MTFAKKTTSWNAHVSNYFEDSDSVSEPTLNPLCTLSPLLLFLATKPTSTPWTQPHIALAWQPTDNSASLVWWPSLSSTVTGFHNFISSQVVDYLGRFIVWFGCSFTAESVFVSFPSWSSQRANPHETVHMWMRFAKALTANGCENHNSLSAWELLSATDVNFNLVIAPLDFSPSLWKPSIFKTGRPPHITEIMNLKLQISKGQLV